MIFCFRTAIRFSKEVSNKKSFLPLKLKTGWIIAQIHSINQFERKYKRQVQGYNQLFQPLKKWTYFVMY